MGEIGEKIVRKREEIEGRFVKKYVEKVGRIIHNYRRLALPNTIGFEVPVSRIIRRAPLVPLLCFSKCTQCAVRFAAMC